MDEKLAIICSVFVSYTLIEPWQATASSLKKCSKSKIHTCSDAVYITYFALTVENLITTSTLNPPDPKWMVKFMYNYKYILKGIHYTWLGYVKVSITWSCMSSLLHRTSLLLHHTSLLLHHTSMVLYTTTLKFFMHAQVHTCVYRLDTFARLPIVYTN